MWIKSQPINGQTHVFNSDFIQYLWTTSTNQLETSVMAHLKANDDVELGRYPNTQMDNILHKVMIAFAHSNNTFTMPNRVIEKEVEDV